MTNSFLSSLTALDTSSVTNVNSLFFYGQVNDNSRLVPAAILETVMGRNLGTFVEVRSAATLTISVSNQVSSFEFRHEVPFDHAVYDDLGQFDANSIGEITMKYGGWVQATLHVDMAPARTGFIRGLYFMSVLKNNTPGYGGEYWDGSFWDTNSSDGFKNRLTTAPFTVDIGDKITAKVAIQYSRNDPTTPGTFSNSGFNWLWVKPLAITVPPT